MLLAASFSIVSLLGPLLLHRLFFHKGIEKLLRWQMVRTNYCGVKIPTAGGMLLLFYNTITTGLLVAISLVWERDTTDLRDSMLLITGSVAMGFWGWQDDYSVEKEIKGFRGHVGTLLRDGRMTSGLMKAWGGGATALLVSLGVSEHWWDVIINTGLLALCSNLLNLFDLRPGRAIKLFWLIISLVLIASFFLHNYGNSFWFMPILGATILYFHHDVKGSLMLGDTGANFLGYIAGFAMILILPLSTKVCMFVLFIAMHLLAEYVSFTKIIQSVGWLQKLDQWGREV